MNNFFIIINSDKKLAEKSGSTIESFLRSQGDRVSYTIWRGSRQDRYELPEGCDCIITIGGDGTLIQAARGTVGSGVPLIGINRGHMGYLTQLTDEEAIVPAMKRLMEEDYFIEERMLLCAEAYRDGERIWQDVALNEVMLARYNTIGSLRFEVYVNDTMLNEYFADGILVATPTGSTAYSLSAGGPIADPKARLIILTPICSHAMNSRSIIFSAHDRFTIVAGSDGQIVACDGVSQLQLKKGDEIRVRRSDNAARFIRLKQESFLETLRQKMTYV